MELGYHLMKLDDLDSIIQPNNYDGVRLRLRMCDGEKDSDAHLEMDRRKPRKRAR